MENTISSATREAIRRIKDELGLNITLGASNASFGLPDRSLLNSAFVAIAIGAGVTSLIVDVARCALWFWLPI